MEFTAFGSLWSAIGLCALSGVARQLCAGSRARNL
jgi:hypothetical protein